MTCVLSLMHPCKQDVGNLSGCDCPKASLLEAATGMFPG